MTFSHGAILATAMTCGMAAAAVAGSPPIGPEHWVAANAADASYVDAQPIIRQDDYAVIWRMRNYPKARQMGDGMVRSVKYQVEYNCTAREQRALYAEMYAGSMATGQLVALSYQQHPWQPSLADGHGFAVACQSVPQPAVVASAP